MKIRLVVLIFAFLIAATLAGRADSYSLALPAGKSLIANHLDNGGNTVAEVLPNVPGGTGFYVYLNGFIYNLYDDIDQMWADPSMTFPPGRGAVIDLPYPTVLVFSGNVRTNILPVNLPTNQMVLLGRQTYGRGTFENIVGYPPEQCGVVEMRRWVGGEWKVYTNINGGWSPPEPLLEIGEAAFFKALSVCNTNAPFRVTGVQPGSVYLCTNVLLTAFGSGFPTGSVMKLVCLNTNPASGDVSTNTLWPTTQTVDSAGWLLSATFNLATDIVTTNLVLRGTDAQVGRRRWDVVVDPGDSPPARLAEGLTIRAARDCPDCPWQTDCQAAVLEVQIQGPDHLPNQSLSTFTLICMSRSNLTGSNVVVSVSGFPAAGDLTIVPLTSEGSPAVRTNETGQALDFVLQSLGGGQVANFPFGLRPHLASLPTSFTMSVQSFAAVAEPRTVEVVSGVAPRTEKLGPRGAGLSRHIAGFEPVSYQITFLNTNELTAQTVEIQDQIDLTKLNLDTFSFGPIVLGTNVFVPTNGVSYQITNDNGVAVSVTASMIVPTDPLHPEWTTNGLLIWDFHSLDAGGFLEPNQMGSVLFLIEPLLNLTNGTRLVNTATVQIEGAPPLEPGWTNTLDLAGPNSSVAPIAGPLDSPVIPVRWTASDSGSGLRYLSVFVNELAGPYSEWLRLNLSGGPANASGTNYFQGRFGRQYSFYSVATDATGNIEARPGTPDASVCVRGLSIDPQNTNAVLRWCAAGTLQFSEQVTVPWTNWADVVPQSHSPYEIQPTNSQRFYRMLYP